MSKITTEFKLIEEDSALQLFAAENKDITWLGFDTEFIGEKRFEALLCLIQVVTPIGVYLIDPLKVKNLQPFLDFIQNPDIVKITHSGDNDYRLLNTAFGTIPTNTFDTQIAAGFVGYAYPIAFVKLVEKEQGVELNKSYAVTDWESRPFKPRQLEYALNDVIYLPGLWQNLGDQLDGLGRRSWALQEMQRLEKPEYYDRDPHKEALGNTLMHSLKPKKKVFLLRLYEWRRETAKKLNHSKEMVLPAKLIGPIVSAIDSGKQALFDNRIIPPKVVKEHWDTLIGLYQNKATDTELKMLETLPQHLKENPLQQLSTELLFLLVKYKCMEEKVAHNLVLNKSDLHHQAAALSFSGDPNDWRFSFLGEELMSWILHKGHLLIHLENGKCFLEMKPEHE